MPKSFDLRTLLDEENLEDKEYQLMNTVGMYILTRVCTSQSMGIIGSGFKNLKSLRTMLAKRFPALPDADTPLESMPYITRQTVAYALSLVVACVCYSYNDTMTKGRSDQVYEKLLNNYSKTWVSSRWG